MRASNFSKVNQQVSESEASISARPQTSALPTVLLWLQFEKKVASPHSLTSHGYFSALCLLTLSKLNSSFQRTPAL